MLAIVITGLILWRRGRLFDTPWYLLCCQFAGALGFIAVLAGWTVTEVGRQPWVVYGLMRTSAALSPSLTTLDVMLSLGAYVLAYVFIFGGGFVLMRRLVRLGPSPENDKETFTVAGRPMRPISAVSDAVSPDGAPHVP
jgi:cytochrome bd ubiquinol oxidase subunit I